MIGAVVTAYLISLLVLTAQRTTPGALTLRVGAPSRTALVAGIAICLLIFAAAAGSYRLFPGLAPDIAGTTTAGGLTPAARAQTNQTESTDPYIAELVLGALLGSALVVWTVAAGRVTRRDTGRAADHRRSRTSGDDTPGRPSGAHGAEGA